MDFKTFLTNRRAIREYKNKEVPLSIVEEILQDTCLAPTASNRQPCRFIIIQDRDLMKRLSDESKGNLLADGIKNPTLLSPDYEARLRDENFNVFYNAPCLVLFIGPKDVRSLDVDVALKLRILCFQPLQEGWVPAGLDWVHISVTVKSSKKLVSRMIAELSHLLLSDTRLIFRLLLNDMHLKL